MLRTQEIINKIDFQKNKGLIPAIIQDYKTNQVLMLAYMNKESFKKTLETGKTWFWSRERKKLWRKGETSGNIQTVKSIYLDCDDDTLLIQAKQKGMACHKGYKSCFFRKLKKDKLKIICKKIFDTKKRY